MKIIKVDKCPCGHAFSPPLSSSGERFCGLRMATINQNRKKEINEWKPSKEVMPAFSNDREDALLNKLNGLTLTPTFEGDFPEWCPLDEQP